MNIAVYREKHNQTKDLITFFDLLLTKVSDYQTPNLTYDAENRLVEVKQGSNTLAAFTYDGDGCGLCTPEPRSGERGNRVKGVVGSITTVYIGNHFEWSGSTTTMKKYYYAGGTRVAMREYTATASKVYYILGDHLGSTTVVANDDGSLYSKQLYKAWGEIRYTYGSVPTQHQNTGQKNMAAIGLYHYGARWYDPYLNRFLSPDSIVPSTGEGNNPNAIGYVANTNYSALVIDYHENQFLEQLNQENRIRLEDPSVRLPGVPTNPLAFDRYAYCFNNPVRYNDPSGHCPACAVAVLGGVGFTISAPVLIIGGLIVVAGVVAYDTFAPGKEQRHAEISAGLTSLTNQATQAANGIQTLFARPGSNQAQNKQFKGAVQQLEKELGRKLSEDEIRRLHEAINDLEDPGFWDIVDQGHKEFDETDDEGNGD